MATQKQIEANRRNAQKSTGPKTAEGKAASRYNALNHGLRAEKLALPHEDAEQVQAFVDAIIEAVAPRDAIEAELAAEIATLSWKLRRAERYEQAVLTKRLLTLHDAGKLDGEDRDDIERNREIAAFDDDVDGRRRRRYISGIRNSLGRARKELRLWQDAHPDPEPEPEPEPEPAPEPEPVSEPEPEVVEMEDDVLGIGFVRQSDETIGRPARGPASAYPGVAPIGLLVDPIHPSLTSVR